MNLAIFEGKQVRIVDTDGQQFTGRVTDYIDPEDNEPEGAESIIIRDAATKKLLEFYADKIKSIEVI